MKRAKRMPMIRPMTMANGVDTRRIFLAGCMELAVSYRIVSKGRATIYQSSPVAVARWGCWSRAAGKRRSGGSNDKSLAPAGRGRSIRPCPPLRPPRPRHRACLPCSSVRHKSQTLRPCCRGGRRKVLRSSHPPRRAYPRPRYSPRRTNTHHG
jgi:hypothetical protein